MKTMAMAAFCFLGLAGCSRQDQTAAASSSAPDRSTVVQDVTQQRTWTPVYTGTNATIYIDKDHITRSGNIATAFNLQDFTSTQTDNNGNPSYKSSVAKSEYDCAGKRFKTDEAATFADNKGVGTPQAPDTNPSDWYTPKPISYAGFMIQAACDGAFNNMDATAAEAIDFKWTKLTEEQYQTTFIAKDNITDDDKNKIVWFMQNFKPITLPDGKPHGRGNSPNEFYSTKYQVEYNCADQTHKVLYYITMSGPMGTGRIETKQDSSDWTPVPQGDDRKAMEMACGTTDAAAPASGTPGDTFTYDPQAAMKQQVIDQETVEMESCVDRNAGALIQAGVRSRSQLKTQLNFCSGILQGGKGIPVDRDKAHQVYERMVDDAVDRFLSRSGQ